MLWYGFGRFWIEELRTDSLMMGPYRISRFLAGIFVITSVILLIVFRKRRSVFGEEGLRLQNEEIAAVKAKKAEEKAGKKAPARKLVDDEAFTETDALADSENAGEEENGAEEEEPVQEADAEAQAEPSETDPEEKSE